MRAGDSVRASDPGSRSAANPARLLSDPGSAAVPQYLIERDIPGAGQLSPEELRGISRKSCDVLDQLGPQIQWQHSYVTGEKVYCVYTAPDEETVREHARRGGFPANRISEVSSIIDPRTAEA